MKWYSPVSIRQIALGFISSLLAMMVLIAGFSAYQTHHVTLGLKQANHEAARSELTAVVERLLRRTENQAEKLSHWDETRQQLVLPEYYAYWRDQRVYESGMLPSRFTRTVLYTTSGKLLAPSPREHRFPAGLPAEVVPNEPTSWLINDGGAIAMFQSFPVYSDEGRQTMLGVGLLRLDFLPELLRQVDFRFVNKDSVGLVLQANASIPASKLLSQLSFSTRSDPDQSRFQTILSSTLLALFVLLTAAALVGFIIYNRLLVRPLGWLSQEIDAMQQGLSSHPLSRARPMRITELENIRRSLYNE